MFMPRAFAPKSAALPPEELRPLTTSVLKPVFLTVKVFVTLAAPPTRVPKSTVAKGASVAPAGCSITICGGLVRVTVTV